MVLKTMNQLRTLCTEKSILNLKNEEGFALEKLYLWTQIKQSKATNLL